MSIYIYVHKESKFQIIDVSCDTQTTDVKDYNVTILMGYKKGQKVDICLSDNFDVVLTSLSLHKQHYSIYVVDGKCLVTETEARYKVPVITGKNKSDKYVKQQFIYNDYSTNYYTNNNNKSNDEDLERALALSREEQKPKTKPSVKSDEDLDYALALSLQNDLVFNSNKFEEDVPSVRLDLNKYNLNKNEWRNFPPKNSNLNSDFGFARRLQEQEGNVVDNKLRMKALINNIVNNRGDVTSKVNVICKMLQKTDKPMFIDMVLNLYVEFPNLQHHYTFNSNAALLYKNLKSGGNQIYPSRITDIQNLIIFALEGGNTKFVKPVILLKVLKKKLEDKEF